MDKERKYEYRAGILVDMIGDAELQLFYEKNSYQYHPNLVREIWRTAEKLKIDNFIPRNRTDVRDDHLRSTRLPGFQPSISSISIIRNECSWSKILAHDSGVPAKCSGESICKVATVVAEWLRNQQ